MIMLVNLGIGLITPPVGSVLFVASAVSKQKIEQVVKAMLPFYCGLFFVLMLVTYIPAISLWLPKFFGVHAGVIPQSRHVLRSNAEEPGAFLT